MASPPVWMLADPDKALLWLRDAVAAGRLTPGQLCWGLSELNRELDTLDLLTGLDLADLFTPTPGDALALGAGALAGGEAWREVVTFEERWANHEQACRRVLAEDPDSVGAVAAAQDCVARWRERVWARAEGI